MRVSGMMMVTKPNSAPDCRCVQLSTRTESFEDGGLRGKSSVDIWRLQMPLAGLALDYETR
jgi:hypothetical protein